MEEKMNEIIGLINEMSKLNSYDYLITILPIVVSIVAIGITIYNACKQNKIQMFEKRYEVVNAISFVAATTQDMLVDKFPDTVVLHHSAEQYISACHPNRKMPNSALGYVRFYRDLEFEINKVHYLFPKKAIGNIDLFIQIFLEHVSNVFGERDVEENRKKLRQEFEHIENLEVVGKLEKYLKL